jgi:UDP-N-acetylmuramoylalanine--D-glutamate ligase
MQDFTQFFKDKRVTVMGLGLLGRGAGDVAYIAGAGATEVIVTDLKTSEQLQASVATLSEYANIRFVLGEHREEDFINRDFILVAAGVPYDSPYLKTARTAGVPLYQSAALFAQLTDIPIIGITGTRGKSTVTHMIHHVLETVTDGEVLLGGNVRGLSNLQLLRAVKADSIAVMELDSWQLQGWGWIQRSPEIAVFTNFMEDHLNYYQKPGVEKEEAMQRYFEDKANIFRYQDDSGVFITVPEVFERAKKLSGVSLGQEVILADGSLLPEDMLLSMPGEHNRLNAALAYSALRATSLSDEEIFHGLATFPGVPGRLQYLGELRDVKLYNDNNATTPQATIQGLRAVGSADDKNVILIAGGAYKNVDPTPLREEIQKYCKEVILLPGTGTDRLEQALHNLSVNRKVVQGDSGASVIKEAVERGLAVGKPGDILLFSPGFASFGLFQNEYERNDTFLKEIEALSIDK